MPNPQREALVMARDTFREYERLHLAKSPPDTVKAARNREMADMCDAALAETYHGYRVGDRVTHERAGNGVVTAIMHDGLHVKFEDRGFTGIYDDYWFRDYSGLLRPTPTQDGGDG